MGASVSVGSVRCYEGGGRGGGGHDIAVEAVGGIS